MFFRMLRLRASVGAGSSPEFPRCERPAGPLHLGVSADAQEERQDSLLRWFLVQPMNIATGRLGSYPEISVASSNRK